jgi:citrate lyase beta subunit
MNTPWEKPARTAIPSEFVYYCAFSTERTMSLTSLETAELDSVLSRLADANAAFSSRYPGIPLDRLPIHTLYGGAHLFKQTTPAKLTDLANRHLAAYAGTMQEFAAALGIETESTELVHTLYNRVKGKLASEAIEDQRLDFEDGYGARSDEEEDSHAEAAAKELAAAQKKKLLPPFIGIRIKSLSEETHARAIRTLDIFLTTYAAEGVALPNPFYVTLPKVTHPVQVESLLNCVMLLESRNGFEAGGIKLELMIETIQSIIDPAGAVGIPALIDAGEGRVTSAILGTFDYTASCNIASHYQDHRHPAADFARQMMQVCLTGTSVNICDGITNIMPIPVHRGENLEPAQQKENRTVVHAAWKLHFNNILHSLRLGFYQGWDLNPAQLPIRYAAAYYFFLQGLDDASGRLKTFINQAAQASMVGNTFDDAASAQGLLNFFVNGINCGALKEEEALASGITLEELHGRSFQQIVTNRLASANQ